MKTREVKLGEVANVKGGKRIPKGIGLINIPNGHPYIRVRDLNNKRLLELDNSYEYVDNETQKVISKYTVKTGDVVLSIVGTIGLVAIVGRTLDGANLTENCVKLSSFHGVNRDFLYYYLRSDCGQQEIRCGTVGAVQAKLPIKNIQNIAINLPDYTTQERIASLLLSIDRKIELNQKINDNLLEQIRTLCTAWLSDYKPFDGAVPSDWVETPLSDIAEFVSGYSYKGSELTDSTIAMATIKNFDRKGGFKLDGYKEIIPSSKLKESQHAELFDTLVAHTDLTQNAEVIGNAEPVMSKSGYDDIIFSMDLVKVLPKKENVSKFLLAAILQDKKFKAHCLGYVNGTTVLHLSKKALPEYKLFLPSDLSKLRPLDEIVTTLYKQISSNISENTYLEELRVALLPKLMSGELDVSGIDL